jgi:hypothetical protein
MTNDKDSEDALTIAYLLGVKHGRAEQPTQTDALKAENERLRSIVYLYVDPSDVTPEDEEFVRAAVNAVLQEQSK